MPTSWRNVYTDLSNVNSGNELENGDDILAQHINVALENGAYVKEKVDEMESLNTIRQHIFSFTIIANSSFTPYIKVSMNLTLRKTQQLTISELKNLLASLGAFSPNAVIGAYDSYDVVNIFYIILRLQYVNDNNLTLYYLREESSVEQGNLVKRTISVSDIRFDSYKII